MYRGPVLESTVKIKVLRTVGCVLTSDEGHFVSLADNFTVQISKLLKLPSLMENNNLTGPVITGSFEKRAPDSIHIYGDFLLKNKLIRTRQLQTLAISHYAFKHLSNISCTAFVQVMENLESHGISRPGKSWNSSEGH